MPKKSKSERLPMERGIQYMQLEYFKFHSYCIAQGIVKKARRKTPSGSAADASQLYPAPLEAAEDALVRLFAKALKSIFDGATVSKTRNVLEFTVLLPDGDWWKAENDSTRAEIASLGNAQTAAYDRHVLFQPPKSSNYRWGWNGIKVPHVLVAPDGEPGSSRYSRRRYETLRATNRSKGRFHDAIKAVIAWKERMDALITEAEADAGEGQQDADRA